MIHVDKTLNREQIEELLKLEELLERWQDHLSVGCCQRCGDHPVWGIRLSMPPSNIKREDRWTPHIQITPNDAEMIRWSPEEED